MKANESSPPWENREYKRMMRNIVLQPLLQIKLGLYSILLALAFSIALALIVKHHMGELVRIVIDLTDVPEEVTEILNDYLRRTTGAIVGALVMFFLANVAMSVFFTHRLIGPTYAFRRHLRALRKGDYAARTVLRKRDAFAEVAHELNQLSEKLETDRNSQPR